MDSTREMKTITLHVPVEAHDRTYAKLTLKEPTGGQYRKHGNPRIFVHTGSNSGYFVTQPNIVNIYLENNLADVDFADVPVVLGSLSLADAIQMEEACIGFFIDADRLNTMRQFSSSSSGATP